MLKTVVLLHIFVETLIHFFSGFFDEWKVQKNSIYLKYKFLYNYAFTVTFDQFNVSWLNTSTIVHPKMKIIP